MDVLWSPWRYDYIKADGTSTMRGCIFCDILSNSATDQENFILKRAEFNFLILNIYPYTSGHLMIVPYEHVGMLSETSSAITNEMMDLLKRAQAAITDAYHPD